MIPKDQLLPRFLGEHRKSERRARPNAVMPETAARYGLKNPSDPKAAIDAAAHYLRDLLIRFDGRLDLALAAYNAGEGMVESFQTGRPLRLANDKIINPRGLVTGGLATLRRDATLRCVRY